METRSQNTSGRSSKRESREMGKCKQKKDVIERTLPTVRRTTRDDFHHTEKNRETKPVLKARALDTRGSAPYGRIARGKGNQKLKQRTRPQENIAFLLARPSFFCRKKEENPREPEEGRKRLKEKSMLDRRYLGSRAKSGRTKGKSARVVPR